jgi:DNA replication protein DnaC
LDFLSALVGDELLRRQDRLLGRRIKQAGFRDSGKTLDNFDLDFNKKMNRQLVYALATARFVERREDVLFLGPPGSGKSHLAQALGMSAIHQGHRVAYREAHVLIEELADATLDRRERRFKDTHFRRASRPSKTHLPLHDRARCAQVDLAAPCYRLVSCCGLAGAATCKHLESRQG